MINSLSLEYAGIVASVVLGAGTATCGVVLVVKMACSLASSAIADLGPTRHSAVRRARRPATDAAIYRAVLDECAGESATSTALDANGGLPVFVTATRRPEPAAVPSTAPATA